MPSSFILVVPTICGTVAFLATLLVLVWVCRRFGVDEAVKLAKAICRLRPIPALVDVLDARRKQPEQLQPTPDEGHPQAAEPSSVPSTPSEP